MESGGPRISHNVRSQIAWAAVGGRGKGGWAVPSLWRKREPNRSPPRLISRVRPSEGDASEIRRGADRTNRERRSAGYAGALRAASCASVSVRGASGTRRGHGGGSDQRGVSRRVA